MTYSNGTWLVAIVETEAAAGSTVTIPLKSRAGAATDWELPKGARIIRASCVLVSGTGTTIFPELNANASFSDVATIWEPDAAEAGPIDQYSLVGWPYLAGSSNFYHRSRVDAAADNVIHTRYLIGS